MTEIKDIAEELNNFFYKCWAKFSQKKLNSSNSFTSFLNQTHSIIGKKLAINKRGFLLIKN